MWPALRDHFFGPLADLVFPAFCLVCDSRFEPAPDAWAVCPKCRAELLHDPFDACPRCAGSIGPFEDLEGGCVRCRDERFAFDGVIRLGPYAGLLRDVVLELKQSPGEPLAEVMGSLWAANRAEQFRALDCTVVTAVPLHWQKRIERGYNPAAAVARSIAVAVNRPYVPLLRRTRYTREQTLLSGADRRKNVKGAFAVRTGQTAQDVRVLLIDDVLTTGSTASAAAEALKTAGAAQVTVAVLARR